MTTKILNGVEMMLIQVVVRLVEETDASQPTADLPRAHQDDRESLDSDDRLSISKIVRAAYHDETAARALPRMGFVFKLVGCAWDAFGFRVWSQVPGRFFVRNVTMAKKKAAKKAAPKKAAKKAVKKAAKKK
jgi:hypothetical protein